MCVNALEYEPCLARVRILMEFLTRAHLVSGRPAQKSTISLPFPKGWPQHFPTSQPAAPLMLCLLTPHSGLRDVVTPCYTTTPHQWHNPPPCPSPPSPGWRNPGSAHTSSLKFKTRWGVCVPTPVFLPGESHRLRSLAGYSPWDHRVRHNWETNTLCSSITTASRMVWEIQ